MRIGQKISIYYDDVLIYKGSIGGVDRTLYKEDVDYIVGCNGGEIEIQLVVDIPSKETQHE